MADEQAYATADRDQDSSPMSGAQLQQWVTAAQDALDNGEDPTLSAEQARAAGQSYALGLPPGYMVDDNGQVVEKGWWDTWGKEATLGMASTAAGGWLAGLSAPASGGTLESMMNAEQAARGSLPEAFGTAAVDTVNSAAPAGGMWSRLGRLAVGGGGGGSKAGGGGGGSLLQRFGLPSISGVFNSVLQNRRANDQLDLEREKLDLEKSQIDQNRPLMDQARDVSLLDRMANQNFTAPPTQVTGRYAHTVAPAAAWTPSDLTRQVASTNVGRLLKAAPDGTGGPMSPGLDPATVQRLLKQRSVVPPVDDAENPWLAKS